MDPREKRDDETMAEWGARLAAMGVAPTPSFRMAGPPVEQFRQLQQLRTPISEVAAAQAFLEPSFVQPSAVPSRQVTEGFQDAMVPVQQQNIPQNVVPITPTDFAQVGMGTVDMPTFIPPADIQPPIDVQTQIDTFVPRGDYAQVMADASVAPVAPAPVAPALVAPAPVATVAQAPAAPTPSPVFVEPAYVAPAEPPPVDVAAARSTVSAPAPFDFSGVSGGRLAKAREFAGQGMFGKAKFHIEKGGGSWSKAMHRALVGETGMSSVELKKAKNAAVNQAKLARQKEHAANVLAAQKKHAANVRAAKAKHAENVRVAELTRQATERQAATRQAFVPPVTDQDYINEGTIPPGMSLDTRGDIFLDTQYKDPTMSDPTGGAADMDPSLNPDLPGFLDESLALNIFGPAIEDLAGGTGSIVPPAEFDVGHDEVITPDPYTGELDRYGLSGWTPELPEVYTVGEIMTGKRALDNLGDKISDTFNNPTLDKVYDIVTWRPPPMLGDKWTKARMLKDAIIKKTKLASKGKLERQIAIDRGITRAIDAQIDSTRSRLEGQLDKGTISMAQVLAAIAEENRVRASLFRMGAYGEYGGGESMAEIQADIDFAGATGGVVD
jgi:hypothetical protein